MRTIEFGEGRYYEIGQDGRPDGFQKLQLILVEADASVYLCVLERKLDLEGRSAPDDPLDGYHVVVGITVPLQDLAGAVEKLREDEERVRDA